MHVVEAGPEGGCSSATTAPGRPDAIAAHGVIAGLDVNCVSRQAQVAMHTGSRSGRQVRDLELLRED